MKRNLLLAISFLLMSVLAFGQRTITGVVTSAEDGSTLPGVSVVVKGTVIGTTTDIDGKYSITVPDGYNTLVFSYVGMKPKEVQIGNQSVINVALESGVLGLDEIVVTAIGIEREKKALGYATQDVSGDEVSEVKNANFINSLSGKVAGVNIRKSNQLGGSANIVVRGYKSLTGNNQPLFVVDGVPISNAVTNTANQRTGRGGFDYGNAAMDINPEDIESVSILKGAAATALYGSRAANGVVLITTKKGSAKKGLGVTFKTGYSSGSIDPSTMPTYQKEYGEGYGRFYGSGPADNYPNVPAGADVEGYFEEYDVNGDGQVDLVAPTTEDASYGAPFNPALMIYTWESLYPELPTYGQPQPWVAGATDPLDFYETSVTTNNYIGIDGGNDNGSFRLSYTNFDQSGVLPNSNIKRNNVNFAGSYAVSDRLKVSSTVNYVNTKGLGRYGTGYDNRNPNQSFRQWYAMNTNIVKLKEAYDNTGKNITWNPYGYGASDPYGPIYFDNYYFNRYENYQNDERNRVFGNMQAVYDLNDWMDFTARVSMDNYSEIQEERIAVGSVDVPMYSRYNRNFREMNYDFILSFNRYLGADDKLNVSGNIGANYRRSTVDAIRASTNGGLVVPKVYSLSNSVSPMEAPSETNYQIGVNGYYARASFGYDQFLYLDLTGRYDISSTLPEGANSYFYPSASLSFVFSELLDIDGLDFGKFRINYAQVGNDAPAQSTFNTYVLNTPFNGVPLASAPATQRNENLKPENTTSIEAGLELNFLKNRAGLDFSVYQSNTYNQIIPVSVSGATGSLFKYVNAGNIQNQGVELALFGSPVKTNDFEWQIKANWSRNRNTVIELFEGQTNLQLASVQGGITLNATIDEPYGAIWGTNYVYHTDGQPIIYPHPFGGVRYRKTSTPEVIGNIQPDWNMGIKNDFSYKNFSFGFLIDIQKGGDFFSLDTWYGFGTGLYDITAGTNPKGNPVRMNPDDGGGIPLEGVVQTGTDADGNPISDGTPNEDYAYMDDVYSSLGWVIAPNAYHVYDASYVKLREVVLTYKLPKSLFDNMPITGIDVSLVGNNLWIISKNAPYTDPEAGLSAGNIQGYQSGAYPSVREVGVNLRINL